MSIILENGYKFGSKKELEISVKNKECVSCEFKSNKECMCSPFEDYYRQSNIAYVSESHFLNSFSIVKSAKTFITKEEATSEYLINRFNYLLKHIQSQNVTLTKQDIKNIDLDFTKAFDEMVDIYLEIRNEEE